MDQNQKQLPTDPSSPPSFTAADSTPETPFPHASSLGFKNSLAGRRRPSFNRIAGYASRLTSKSNLKTTGRTSTNQPNMYLSGEDGSDTPITPNAAERTNLPNTNYSIRRFLPLIVVLIGLLILIYVFRMFTSPKSDPTSVFNQAISNALSTKLVEQVTESGMNTQDIKFDLSNIKNPKVSSISKLQITGIDAAIETYGNLKNTYFKYNAIAAQGVSIITPSSLNKWVKLRQNGVANTIADQTIANLADPRVEIFGQFIFGNFSSSQRKTLVTYNNKNKIYTFDVNKVKRVIDNSSDEYVYPVTLNLSNLATYNKQVAAFIGLSDNDIQTVTSAISSGPKTADIYINLKTRKVDSVVSTLDSLKTTITYSNYNHLKLPAEPKSQLDWVQYTDELRGSIIQH